jgi:protein SCO1/2
MSSHFAELHRAVRADAGLASRVRLLTVSFDPEFDTPEVLRSYGGAYVGKEFPDDFRVWEFATGTRDEVKAISAYFGLTYWKETGEIVHSLRTALIDPNGRLVQVYRGNEWKPSDVIQQVRVLLKQPLAIRMPQPGE